VTDSRDGPERRTKRDYLARCLPNKASRRGMTTDYIAELLLQKRSPFQRAISSSS